MSYVSPTYISSDLFYARYDCLERLGIVHCQVGQDLAVDFNAGFVKFTHQLRVGKALQACSRIDSLNPQGAEVAFLVATVTIGIGQTFFPSVLGYGPHIFACSKIAAG